MTTRFTGGCQCGAVRFSCGSLGRASICHCRMCQKAFGGYFGPLVTGRGVVWTRGAPAYFQSSNKVRRGFCRDCGTPLTFEPAGGAVDLAIGAFDHPKELIPVIQLASDMQLPSFDSLHALPTVTVAGDAAFAAHCAGIVSHQHPDHDTDHWPP